MGKRWESSVKIEQDNARGNNIRGSNELSRGKASTMIMGRSEDSLEHIASSEMGEGDSMIKINDVIYWIAARDVAALDRKAAGGEEVNERGIEGLGNELGV